MTGSTPAYQVTARHWTGEARLLRVLDEAVVSRQYRHSVYLTPGSLDALRQGRPSATVMCARAAYIEVVLQRLSEHAGESDTGLALFWGDNGALVVLPPFPLSEDSFSSGVDISGVLDLLGKDLLVGVILLRLGHYAVGMLRGHDLVASKSGSRYVKSRHRAGGSSQRRFERSRERLVRELLDKACQTVEDVLAPFADRMDYVLLGGERHTLRAFTERCSFARGLTPKTLSRTLAVNRPGREALEGIHHEVWKSRVLLLSRV